MWWERDERAPYVHHYPGIIRCFGYEPWPEPVTLGEKLLAERRRQGLSIKRAAEIVGVDEGTFGRWESGDWTPQRRSLLMIGAFLSELERAHNSRLDAYHRAPEIALCDEESCRQAAWQREKA